MEELDIGPGLKDYVEEGRLPTLMASWRAMESRIELVK